MKDIKQDLEKLIENRFRPDSNKPLFSCISISTDKEAILTLMQQAYNLGAESKEEKLFSAFTKSLLDSGAYTITGLKAKEPILIKEAYEYWVNNLPEYSLPSPPKQ